MATDSTRRGVETLEYIQSMLEQLRSMAELEKCDMLSFLIEMAYLEACDTLAGARPSILTEQERDSAA